MVNDGLRRTNLNVTNLDVTNTSGTNINGTTVTGTTINGVDVNVTGSTTVAQILQQYENGKGVIINNIPASTPISGGTWAIGSAGSGITVAPTVVAGAAFAGTPLGICLADVPSGANALILARGFYQGMIAADTVNVGDTIRAGAGGALNTIESIGSDAAQMDSGFGRGVCLMGGGSEAVTSVYLW